jgi:hypothetical protein
MPSQIGGQAVFIDAGIASDRLTGDLNRLNCSIVSCNIDSSNSGAFGEPSRNSLAAPREN